MQTEKAVQYCIVLCSALVSLPSADCTHLPGSKEGGGDLWWRKDVQDNDEDVDDDLDGDDDLNGGIISFFLSAEAFGRIFRTMTKMMTCVVMCPKMQKEGSRY